MFLQLRHPICFNSDGHQLQTLLRRWTGRSRRLFTRNISFYPSRVDKETSEIFVLKFGGWLYAGGEPRASVTLGKDTTKVYIATPSLVTDLKFEI